MLCTRFEIINVLFGGHCQLSKINRSNTIIDKIYYEIKFSKIVFLTTKVT